MTKLTPRQRIVLKAAAADTGCASPPEDKSVVARLIKAGFLISIPQEGGQSRLMVTEAGLAAIGIGAAPAISEATRGSGPAPAVAATDEVAPPTGKIGILVELMRQEGGASILDLMAATGWQAHSVRGAISGAVKKTLKLNVISSRDQQLRTYRIP